VRRSCGIESSLSQPGRNWFVEVSPDHGDLNLTLLQSLVAGKSFGIISNHPASLVTRLRPYICGRLLIALVPLPKLFSALL
jgi:hypothetical protein